MSDPLTSSKRLVLFAPGAGSKYRRTRLAVAATLFLVLVSLIAPVYPLFARLEPFVLGFPFAFAWVIGALLVSFAAVLVLFLREDPDRPHGGR